MRLRRPVPLFLLGLVALAPLWPPRACPQAATALGASQPAPVIFHVAPDGRDDNPGTAEKPFATVQRGRDAIRALRREQGGRLKQAVRVRLRGGTFALAAPLTLTPEDSGTKDGAVIYEAADEATPVLSGGRQIGGWKQTTIDGKRLWAADVPDVKSGKLHFRQLWVNGQRRPRARHPNDGFLKVAGVPDADAKTPYNQGQHRFRFAAGDLRSYKNLEDVDVVLLHLWVSVRLAVAAVDEKENLVSFVAKSRRRLTDGNEPARYYVENAFELLDTPGEWYLDRKSGTLYYWPMPGETPDKVEVIAPVLPHLLRIEGRPEKGEYVEHVWFDRLTFAHAEAWPARDDPADIQAAASLPAAVQLDGASEVLLDRCTVAHVSGYGVQLGRGCRHNAVTRCQVRDLGAGGIKVGETAQRAEAALRSHHNHVTDCHVHGGGRAFHQGIGVWVGQTHGNLVARNHIHDFYYTGISCGWTWGYGKTLAGDNRIEGNHVHDIGQGWLSDLGGVYTLGTQPGTVIRGNVFHDISAHRYGGWGIYFDEGTSQVVAENNLVYRTTHGGFHQHFGKENVVRNNVFAHGRDAQIRLTRPEAHRSFTFERNIVYFKEGKLLDGRWDKADVAFAKNLYWREGGGELKFDRWSWDEWRKRGHDTEGATADPLFVDPAKAEFGLRDGSPALKLGFVPLNLKAVGPRR